MDDELSGASRSGGVGHRGERIRFGLGKRARDRTHSRARARRRAASSSGSTQSAISPPSRHSRGRIAAITIRAPPESPSRSSATARRSGSICGLSVPEPIPNEDVTTFGVQGYLQPDQQPERLLAGVVRSLAPQILASGIATEEELGLDTLDARLAEAVAAEGSVVLPPCVAGAWAVRS
jgi:hypothetical protein